MTTERNDNDARVSQVYREAATEKTPPELDRKILSMAATGTRSRYGRARAWIRPMAWAATIGLSLAFVLELTQVPESAPISAGGSDADIFEVLDEEVASEAAPARAKSDQRLRQESEVRSDAPATMLSAPAAIEAEAEADRVVGEFEANDMSLMRDAEEQARAQAGQAQQRPAATTGFSALVEKKEQAPGCDADARATAQSWYECVEELRQAGLAELATRELESLLGEFPDFKVPATSR